jgi:hypothetical protein
MFIESPRRSNDQSHEISHPFFQCSSDILIAQVEALRGHLMSIASEKPKHIREHLPRMLEIINQFVTQESDKVASRLLACGYISIENVSVIRVQTLARLLGISRQYLNTCLGEMKWEREEREVWQKKIASAEYFPDYPFLFFSMSPLELYSFQFRIRYRTMEVPDEQIAECAEIARIVADEPRSLSIPELRSKLGNAMRANKELRKTVAQFKRALWRSRISEVIADPVEEPVQDNVQDLWESISIQKSDLQDDLMAELIELKNRPSKQRRYSVELCKFGFLLDKTCAQSYRILIELLPFPTGETVDRHFANERRAIMNSIQSPENLPSLLNEYRQNWSIPPGQIVPSTLAFDATSVSNTGIQVRKSFENCFAFVLLPLQYSLPDLLVHSMAHGTGRVDDRVLATKDALIQVLVQNDFWPNFIATDGDNGVMPFHREAFALYEDFSIEVSLGEVVNHLTVNGPLTCRPISDYLHLLKNARSRIATGILSFDADSQHAITAESLNNILHIGPCLEAHSPLDLLRDDLALRTFTIGNLMSLWKAGELVGVYFFLPFVALSVAIRDELISRETRLNLIQLAFSLFFKMKKQYPQTGVSSGIYEVGKRVDRKTLWTQVMCIRACNLCIGLYWAINQYPEGLRLGRIGTHSVECLFGTTRSMLRGDTRWDRFLGAQVDAIIVQKLLKEFDLQPYIRRFRNISGVTLMGDNSELIDVSFDDVPRKLEGFQDLLRTFQEIEGSDLAGLDNKSIAWGFVNLCTKLKAAGYTEKILRSSLTRGACIVDRFFAASLSPEEPNIMPEDWDDVILLADE